MVKSDVKREREVKVWAKMSVTKDHGDAAVDPNAWPVSMIGLLLAAVRVAAATAFSDGFSVADAEKCAADLSACPPCLAANVKSQHGEERYVLPMLSSHPPRLGDPAVEGTSRARWRSESVA